MLQMTSTIVANARIIAAPLTNSVRKAAPDARKWGEYIHTTLFGSQEKVSAAHAYKVSCIIVKSVAGLRYVGYSGNEGDFLAQSFAPRLWPKNANTGRLADVTGTREPIVSIVLHDHPAWYGLRDELIAYNTAMKAAAAERDAFIDGVEKICDHYDTLNEALAAWPALRFLMSRNTQTQDFPFDGTPKPLPDGVDIAELTAMVTRAKLEV